MSTVLHPDAVFDAGWLELRAAADRAARAPRLEALAADWLRARAGDGARALRIVDLGSGGGANVLHLAPRLPGPQRWTLIDHDASLLARARPACAGLRAAGGGTVSVETLCRGLHLPASALADADLVCASALLDLVDAAWLDALAAACAAAGCAVLATLSVDGHWRFVDTAGRASGAETDDDFVRAAFDAHQRRDKGLGPALGPDATAALAARLRTHGFAVECMPSPWRLDLGDPAHARLARALADGWRAAAGEHCPQDAGRIAAWHARCVGARLRSGMVLEVGHVDLLGLPADAPAGNAARPR